MKCVGASLRRAVVPALALITALGLGSIVIVLTDVENLQRIGTEPGAALAALIGGVLEAYGAIVAGAIGDPGQVVASIQGGEPTDVARAIRPITETLLGAAPFIFVGLALAVSFHAGLFNFGADGQFLMGGFGAVSVASLLSGVAAPGLALIAGVAAGALFGAAYGFLPGLLKARTGAHEVITTLMLNPIAPNLASFIVSLGIIGPPSGPLPQVPLLFDVPTIRLDYGFIAALVVAAAVSFLLFRTRLGFELRAIGFSRSAARGAGIRPGRSTVIAMSISGALVGLGSGFYILGPAEGLGGPPTYGMGYVALALALIAGLRPAGVVLVAVLYGALDNGGKNMVIVTGIPLALVMVIIGLALMFVAAPGLIRSVWRLRTGGGPQAGRPDRGAPAHGI